MWLMFDGDYIKTIAVIDDLRKVVDIIIENEKKYDEDVLDIQRIDLNSEHIKYEVIYPDSDECGTNTYNLIKFKINQLLD